MLNYNIATKARMLLLNKLVLKRREWQVMMDNRDPDISYLGKERLQSYRTLMIEVVCSTDLLQATPAIIVGFENTDIDEHGVNFINDMTRFMITDLTASERLELYTHYAEIIYEWTVSKGVSSIDRYDDDVNKYVKAITEAILNNPLYLTLILLVDLHHLTFVEKADSCYEILLSTLRCYSIQGMG